MDFNKTLLQRSMTKKRLMRQVSRYIGESHKIRDEHKHIFLSEKNIVSMLELAEPMTMD